MDEDNQGVFLSRKNKLNISPTPEIRFYNVSLNYYSGIALKQCKRLDYTVSVAYLNQDRQEYPHKWQVDKGNIFFNQKQPSLVLEEISVFLLKAIYPINITTDHWGGLIEITNHNEILDRWSSIKKKIIKEHRGDFVFKLIKKFERLLKNPTKLQLSLSNEIFWSVFFAKRYQEYGNSYQKKVAITFPLEAYKTPLIYKGLMKLNSSLSTHNSIELDYEGKTVIPSLSNLHVGKESHTLTSALDIHFNLDIETKIPNSVRAFCDVYDETKNEDISQMEILITLDKYKPIINDRSPENGKEKIPNEELTPKKKKKWFSFGF
ncbi:hypothetical protein Q4566_15745 [Tamlana sp. 2_MG-2023]|uniref:hypothetical protein n=1 Tax=unclassified Tamlana TaxID=2614803 RepID=UPI0026E23962|nr:MULTISPECIES: hypothetical protein [unclassified Tamlana]MDO6761660.1 hypothetical protein [Tamlana sp. 2_MG-2023]MDO6792486.1 hypothetical protein [Tamlana sp. 1_MG-2023]